MAAVSLELANAEQRYTMEIAADTLSPEKIYQRSWAMSVLEQALGSVQQEWKNSGKDDQFNTLKVFLTPALGETNYRDIALELNMTEGSVKTAVHRLRRAYKLQVRDIIAQTVSSEEEIESEISELYQAFGS